MPYVLSTVLKKIFVNYLFESIKTKRESEHVPRGKPRSQEIHPGLSYEQQVITYLSHHHHHLWGLHW